MARNLLIAFALVVLALPLAAGAAQIDPELQQLMYQKSQDEMYPALMIFHEYPELTPGEIGEGNALDPNKRRKRIIALLKKKVQKVQQSSTVLLDRPDMNARVANVQQLYLANAIAFDGNREMIESLAEVDVEATIFHDKTYDLTAATQRGPVVANVASKSIVSTAAVDTAWGVTYINADRVWTDLGYNGSGVVVAHIDSGVWLTHPDLANQLWVNPGEIAGNGLDDDNNGFIDDVVGWDFGVNDNDPNDDSPSNGHGTHTAGTVVGDGTGGTITGVAPGASLMALKVWQANGSGGTLGMIWAAEQYAAENGARVITMSLGIPGDIPDAYMRADRFNFNNLRAAGVLMFNSAGNDHFTYDPPIELSLTARVPSPWSPAGASYSHTSGVATIGGTGYKNDTVYNSSSRGPADWGTVDPWLDYAYNPGDGLIKPDVAAPGVGVNSTVIPSGYSGDSWSGTSMACPHAAGVAALMLSKNPSLSPAGIDSLMQQNSIDLGLPGKDNDFGSGRVDAYAIVQAVPAASMPDVYNAETYPDFPGDEIFDPGETAPFAFQLQNVSQVQDAVTVTASLAVLPNPWVTVTDAAATFPDLPLGGGLGDNMADPFQLTIDPSAPQGYDFTLLLTISDSSGFQRTFDIPWYVGLPKYRTHNAGSAYLTVTDQGSIGYLDQSQADGAGFGYLDGGSVLYVGSFWAGTDATYICNRDFSGNGVETYEWVSQADPNGRVRDLGAVKSDQTYAAIFNDSGHASPKPLEVKQYSFAFTGEPNDDFVILEYTLTNGGATDVNSLYTGVFCDFDIADSGANEGGSDAARNLIYMYSAGGPYYGIAVLSQAAHNLTLVSNPTYVYPLLYIEDSFKMRHLSGLISVPTSPAPDDWSALASARIDLPAGGTETVAYAMVYGETLVDLQNNVDAAQAAYDPLSPVSDEAPVKLVRLEQNHPNPFNPSTTIRFETVRTGHVDLAVYDMSGRRIRTLVSGTREAGPHVVTWNGADDTGARVPSGIYFCRYVTDGQSVSRKMTLIK